VIGLTAHAEKAVRRDLHIAFAERPSGYSSLDDVAELLETLLSTRPDLRAFVTLELAVRLRSCSRGARATPRSSPCAKSIPDRPGGQELNVSFRIAAAKQG